MFDMFLLDTVLFLIISEIRVNKHSTIVSHCCLSCINATEHHTTFCRITKQSFTVYIKYTLADANRLSSTIGGNREMNQLYTTSQVSNITRKTKFSHTN